MQGLRVGPKIKLPNSIPKPQPKALPPGGPAPTPGPESPPPKTTVASSLAFTAFGQVSIAHKLLWAGVISYFSFPILQNWFPQVLPLPNSSTVIAPIRASEEQRRYAIEKLSKYGIVDAERRVQVYQTSYKKGEKNAISSIGTRYYINLFVPTPFFATAESKFGDLFPALKESQPAFADQTLASGDSNKEQFLEERKRVVAASRVLPLSDSENDFAWHTAAAEIQVKAATRPFGIGLLSIGGFWITSKVLLRPPFLSRPLHPFIQNRLAEIPLIVALGGMLWASRTVGELMVHRIVGNSVEMAQLGVQYAQAQQLYNVVRGRWFIDANGNDLSDIIPAERRIHAFTRCIKDISELSDMRHIVGAGNAFAASHQDDATKYTTEETSTVVGNANK